MVHDPCGCRASVDFDDAIRYVDGFPCPRKAGEHLWVRQPELVYPTARCKLVEAQDELVLYGADRVLLREGLASGDYAIDEWNLTPSGVLRVIVGARERVLFPV